MCTLSNTTNVVSEEAGHAQILTYQLPTVRTVGDLDFWNMFRDGRHQLLRREAHSSHVVHPSLQPGSRRHHELPESPETVLDVHHGQACVGTQVALELAASQNVMEDGHSVICRRTVLE